MNAAFDESYTYIKSKLDIVGVDRERLFATMEIMLACAAAWLTACCAVRTSFWVNGHHGSIGPLQGKSVKRTADGVLRR